MTGTAIATRDQSKAQLVTGGDVAAIIPRNIEEVFRLAGAIAASNMAPASLNTPEKVTIAILAGAELGLPPFQAIQSFAVVNNRPTIWGDGLIAVVRSNGFQVKEWLEGDGDNTVAHCEVTRPDNGEVIYRTFSVADAKKANLWGKTGPWQTSPKRMLQMRARGFACRDGAADVLRGFQLREEVEDYQPVREERVVAQVTGTGMRERLEARSQIGEGFDAGHVSAEIDAALDGDTLPLHDAETGEIIDAEVETGEPAEVTGEHPEVTAGTPGAQASHGLADADFDHVEWSGAFVRSLENLDTVEEVATAWEEAKTKGFVFKVKAKRPDLARQIADAVNARVAAIKAAA